jgi:hypothetical protein
MQYEQLSTRDAQDLARLQMTAELLCSAYNGDCVALYPAELTRYHRQIDAGDAVMMKIYFQAMIADGGESLGQYIDAVDAANLILAKYNTSVRRLVAERRALEAGRPRDGARL